MRRLATILIVALAACACLQPTASARTTSRQVAADAETLSRAKGGPPGVFVQAWRRGFGEVFTIGRRDRARSGAPDMTDHMRIASMTKAFTGALVLKAVKRKQLALDDTIGARLPELPATWHAVTIRQLMNHTSGVPDYTKSEGFVNQFRTNPTGTVTPNTLIDWVRATPVNFPPGGRYLYSNTDNIVLALMLEKVTGSTYAKLLRNDITSPLALLNTRLPTSVALRRPFIHGYVTDGKQYDDVTEALSPSGAWASGGIESTPSDVNDFFHYLLEPRYLNSAALTKAQRTWVPNAKSSPAGPGANSAGLSLFRYKTRCGIVYGHTGSFPGYTQFAAASKDGAISVTTTINISDPAPKLLARLRELQTKAICLAFRR